MPIMLRALLWICSTIENDTFQKWWLSHKHLTQELLEQALFYVHGLILTRVNILEAAVKTKFVVIQDGLDHALQSYTWALFPTKHPDGHSLSMSSLQDMGTAALRQQTELNLSVLYLEELQKWLFQSTCKCLYNMQSTTALISFLQI